MQPKKIWANLAVSDLDRTTAFYTRLGFKPNGRSKELTSFMFGDNEFVIHFFLSNVLEEGSKGPMADLGKGSEVIFTVSADSRAEVDLCEAEVAGAGGKLLSHAEEFGDGYYGFVFADPDGHKFNVFYM